jgi:murein DD-endopeptidase MepM/ murein hydrolase activator NlpD
MVSETNPRSHREYKRAALGADRRVPRRLGWVIALGCLAIAGTVAGVRAIPEPTVAWSSSSGVVPGVPRVTRSFQLEVRPGDTLSRLFERNELSLDDLDAIMAVGGPTARLRSLMPGDVLLVRSSAAGRVIGLAVDVDESRRLEVERGARGFAVRSVEVPLERRAVRAEGSIESSLFASASSAGLSGRLTMALAGVFGYDIDFLQDLRRGDRFVVLYEEIWREGEKLRDGPILAAEFVNDGRVLRAVRYSGADGRTDYYAPDGGSMRKALTRNPVDFTRVSSGFSTSRRHPILNRVRAHQGVDYAAPAGTPVRAAGDGKVVFRGMRGGYGNAVVIQHGATYSTLYAHLSQFARGLGVGSRVAQDQVIGFVGASGLATAPHLHYEVLVEGVHRNPRTVDLPDAAPIAATDRARFEAEAQRLLRLLAARDAARATPVVRAAATT